MGGWHRPRKCKEVEAALKQFGFTPCEKQGKGSHQHWEATVSGMRRVVTIACHRGEVKANDYKSIIAQSGIPRKAWNKLVN